MDSGIWSAISAGASAVSATVAPVIRSFTGKAANAQNRVADFNNCLEVVKQLAEAQRRVRDASDDTRRIFEFRELLNLFEALALLINEKKIPPSTRHYAGHFLEEAWAWLETDAEMADLVMG